MVNFCLSREVPVTQAWVNTLALTGHFSFQNRRNLKRLQELVVEALCPKSCCTAVSDKFCCDVFGTLRLARLAMKQRCCKKGILCSTDADLSIEAGEDLLSLPYWSWRVAEGRRVEQWLTSCQLS